MITIDRAFEIKEVTPSGAFHGYGNVYGVVDQGNDVVAHGAFANSLAQMRSKGRQPAMLWQHRSGEPIGAYQSVREDSKGLHVEGTLALKTVRGAEAYELVKMGAISGLSIGFDTKHATTDQKSGVRTIAKADLHEISLVTFPMNDDSRISGVKGLTKPELEQRLRDAGFSQREAKRLVAGGFAALCNDTSDESDRAAAAAARIRQLNNLLRTAP